ncbi:MAG: hypothetical protein GY817_01115 [bacterium]|nr:hypothetical protein [bacterium]
MINWTDIENSLHSWAFSFSGNIQAIWDNQNAPQPKPTYISLNINNVQKIGGYDDVRQKNGKEYLCGMRKITLKVQAYGSKSLIALTKLKDSLEFPVVEQNFKNVGLAVVEALDILNTSIDLETVWENRHSMDIFFHVASNVEMPDSIFLNKVDIGGELLDDQDNKHQLDVEINNP